MIKKIAALLCVLILLVAVAACSEPAGEEVDGSNGQGENGSITVVPGKFTVGFDQNFPPMGFVGDDGEFTGFDLELAKEVADRLGLDLVLQPIAWDAKDMELSTKNIDCIWNGFTMNGREELYTWTKPYMANKQVFVVRADSGLRTLADLTGKSVVVQVDSSAEAALAQREDLVDSFGEYLAAPDYENALMDLEAGAVDAVAMDEVVANYKIEKGGADLLVLDEQLAAEEYGVGFLLGNEELRDDVQRALEEMAAAGILQDISVLWFGKDVTTLGR
jgi:polar amino acid transport system substrate-binding protein